MLLLPAFVGAPEINKVYHCDAMTLLRALPSGSVDCCVTSPPYFGLRDYGIAGQIGLEKTPAEYVHTLVTLFRELRRVLKDSGTFWLNLGDSYTGGWSSVNPQRDMSGGFSGKFQGTRGKQGYSAASAGVSRKSYDGLASKNLLLIPHRAAIALQDDGWIVRQDNVWHKPNPMPESVTDRTTRSHEYVFQLVKSGRYYFDKDAISEPVKKTSINRHGRAVSPSHKYINGSPGQTPHSMNRARPNSNHSQAYFDERHATEESPMANKKSVWTIATAQSTEAHFAVFPNAIPELCIKAGCPPGGLVLDMFMGSGTTADVARRLGRDFIGSELNIEYVDIANRRLAMPYTPNMFIDVPMEAVI